MLTQSGIAERLGMPRATVAAALNPRLENSLCLELRERIQAAARSMGYVPNHAARRLACGRTDSHTRSFDQIGLLYLIHPNEGVDMVCLGMMSGAERELSKLHATITFVRLSEPADWDKVDRMTQAGRVDGWLVYGAVTDEIVNRLNECKLPFVILGDHRCTGPVNNVNVDARAVGCLAVEHLAALGHRRIAYMAGSARFVYQEQILVGFRDARQEVGLDDDDRSIICLASAKAPGAKGALGWLQNLDPMPTAVFMPDLGVAVSLYPAIRHSHDESLRDIEVLAAGFAASEMEPHEFTRIVFPMREVGRRGAELLHRLASEPTAPPREVRVPPQLGDKSRDHLL